MVLIRPKTLNQIEMNDIRRQGDVLNLEVSQLCATLNVKLCTTGELFMNIVI